MKNATQIHQKGLRTTKGQEAKKIESNTDKILASIFMILLARSKKFLSRSNNNKIWLPNSTTMKNDSRHLLADKTFRVINVLWNLGHID